MTLHAPPGYPCPFCRIGRAEFEGDDLLTSPQDVVFRSPRVVAFIASHWWLNNPGHALIIPIQHVENMYDLPADLAGEIHEVARKIALAMRQAYKCPGISTRQHNEPAGGQDVWHYHLHVFPRYANDELYLNHRTKRATTFMERRPYAERLQKSLNLF